MIKQMISLIFSVLFCISAFGHAGDRMDRSTMLSGSRQGYSVGFVDADGDGIDDMIVGAPYAISPSNIGAALV